MTRWMKVLPGEQRPVGRNGRRLRQKLRIWAVVGGMKGSSMTVGIDRIGGGGGTAAGREEMAGKRMKWWSSHLEAGHRKWKFDAAVGDGEGHDSSVQWKSWSFPPA